MKFITGKLNSNYLETILLGSIDDTNWVKAAIAYASDEPKLLDFCQDNKIKLQYWGRYDYGIAVKLNILKRFLNAKSPNFECRLLNDYFHAKVIWWGGYGAYIGSANLTNRAWQANIECGVFIPELELNESGMDIELDRFFTQLKEYDFPLTDEIYEQLCIFNDKQKDLAKKLMALNNEFNKVRLAPFGQSPIGDNSKNDNTRKNKFLEEWNATLQILRDLADKISIDENRPTWIERNVPKGIQVDQFLHSYYYSYVRDGNRYPVHEYHEKNHNNPELAVNEIIVWWKNLDSAPNTEQEIIDDWSVKNALLLSKENLKNITIIEFVELCLRIHSLRTHARQVRNSVLDLPPNSNTTEEERIELFARYVWKQRTSDDMNIIDVIYFVLYDSDKQYIPERLWQAKESKNLQISHIGISILGEIVGWAIPNTYPPRNKRTSKALYALGYDVEI